MGGASILVNFGESGPWSPLPFTATMIQQAAKDDVKATTVCRPKKGVYEVVVPVGIPDEGTYDLLDDFLAANPGKYTEISARAVNAWVQMSGHAGRTPRGTNDHPELGLNIHGIDDLSIMKQLRILAASQRRNYVIMDVKANLLAASRKEIVNLFSATHFQVFANVSVGAPSAEFIKN